MSRRAPAHTALQAVDRAGTELHRRGVGKVSARRGYLKDTQIEIGGLQDQFRIKREVE